MEAPEKGENAGTKTEKIAEVCTPGGIIVDRREIAVLTP
jgi:hypothetical protein